MKRVQGLEPNHLYNFDKLLKYQSFNLLICKLDLLQSLNKIFYKAQM